MRRICCVFVVLLPIALGCLHDPDVNDPAPRESYFIDSLPIGFESACLNSNGGPGPFNAVLAMSSDSTKVLNFFPEDIQYSSEDSLRLVVTDNGCATALSPRYRFVANHLVWKVVTVYKDNYCVFGSYGSNKYNWWDFIALLDKNFNAFKTFYLDHLSDSALYAADVCFSNTIYLFSLSKDTMLNISTYDSTFNRLNHIKTTLNIQNNDIKAFISNGRISIFANHYRVVNNSTWPCVAMYGLDMNGAVLFNTVLSDTSYIFSAAERNGLFTVAGARWVGNHYQPLLINVNDAGSVQWTFCKKVYSADTIFYRCVPYSDGGCFAATAGCIIRFSMNGEPVSKITCFGPVNMTVNAMNLFTSSWNAGVVKYSILD